MCKHEWYRQAGCDGYYCGKCGEDFQIEELENHQRKTPKCDCGGAKLRHTSHSAWCSTQPTTTPPFKFDPTKRLF